MASYQLGERPFRLLSVLLRGPGLVHRWTYHSERLGFKSPRVHVEGHLTTMRTLPILLIDRSSGALFGAGDKALSADRTTPSAGSFAFRLHFRHNPMDI